MAAIARYGCCLLAACACSAAGAGSRADSACSHAGARAGGAGRGCGPAQHEQPGGDRHPQGAAVFCIGRLILWFSLRSAQLLHLVLHRLALLLSIVLGMKDAHGGSLSSHHLRMRSLLPAACGCSRWLVQQPHLPHHAFQAGRPGPRLCSVAALNSLSRRPPGSTCCQPPTPSAGVFLVSWWQPQGLQADRLMQAACWWRPLIRSAGAHLQATWWASHCPPSCWPASAGGVCS